MRTFPGKLCAIAILAISLGYSFSTAGPNDSNWIHLFNSVDLEGWTVKFDNRDLNEIPKNCIYVKDSIMYFEQSPFPFRETGFGHLAHDDKILSHYLVRVEYKFLSKKSEGDLSGNYRERNGLFNNSGIMLHSQTMESMNYNQNFPNSLEMQFLGDKNCQNNHGPEFCPASPNSSYEPHTGITGNLCTPGTYVFMNGEDWHNHCTNAKHVAVDDSEWVEAEALVLGDSLIQHIIKGEVVMEYSGSKLNNGDKQLTEGVIALQAESSDILWRKVDVLNFKGCMDTTASNYKSYHIKEDNSRCDYTGCMLSSACNYNQFAQTPCADCCRYTDLNSGECTCANPDGCPLGIISRELSRYGIQIGPNLINIAASGVHTMEITAMDGSLAFENTDAGPKHYLLEEILGQGVFFIRINHQGNTFVKKVCVLNP